MKNLIRFLVLILLAIILAATIYCFFINDNERNLIKNDINQEKNETLEEEVLINDQEENNLNIVTDMNNVNNQEVLDINEFASTFENIENMQVIEGLLESDMLGKNTNEFFDAFELEKMPVTIQKTVQNTGTRIELIPLSDFLDTQMFFYNDIGNLNLYISVSNTIGGNIGYYFSDDVLVQIINNMDEEITPTFEKQDEILERANKLYKIYNKN